MVKCVLEILHGDTPVKIKKVFGQFDQDGGGSSSGFGVVSNQDITANTDIPALYGDLVPIPTGKQVMPLSKKNTDNTEQV